MNPTTLILGLIPLASFAILPSWLPVGWAAVIGAAAAVVVLLTEIRHRVKTLPLVQFVILGVIALIAFTGGPFTDVLLHHYGRGLASLALALYIFATLGFAPFTAQFAKDFVPKEQWGTERFRTANRRLSATWGAAVLAIAVSHLITGAFEVTHVGAPIITFALNWGVPVLVVLWALKVSKQVAARGAAPTVKPAA
jgi:choline-glycine betaine transporter